MPFISFNRCTFRRLKLPSIVGYKIPYRIGFESLIRGWALIKFLPFLASEVCLFCNKTINANNKTRRSNKARFLYNTLKKTPSSGKSLIRIYSLKWVGWGWALIWVWLGGGGGGRLLTFSAFRMGAYSRWALIRGWALIRINTVPSFRTLCPFKLLQRHCISIWVKHKTRTFFYCDLLTVNKCVLFWNKKNKVIFSTRLNQQLIFFFYFGLPGLCGSFFWPSFCL